jgi:hypothetical protein
VGVFPDRRHAHDDNETRSAIRELAAMEGPGRLALGVNPEN